MFSVRSEEKELMDSESFDKVLAEQSFKFIEMVNKRFGGSRIVEEFVASEALKLDRKRPLRILDIGSGSCDIPISVCNSLKLRHIPVEFTCVEFNHHAVERAQKLLHNFPNLPIRVVCEDIFHHNATKPYDIAIGSMFFHHLKNPEIIALIDYLRKLVSSTVLINDLERCWANYIGALLLTIPESTRVRNDATLSVKRGFRINELIKLFEDLPQTTLTVKRCIPFRIAAFIRYSSESSHYLKG